jgi:hypothetical protein
MGTPFFARLASRVLLAAAIVAPALIAGSAHAAAIAAFSGNTQPFNSTGEPIGGTINFAVYNRTGGTAGDTFGTGLAGFDALFTPGASSGALSTGSQFLYLYQTVNNGPSSGSVPIFRNTVGVAPALVTSFGSFSATSFSTTILGTPAGFANTSPASTPATPGLVGGQTGLNSPVITLGLSSLQATFFSELTGGTKSLLWGFTSNTGPAIGSTAIIDASGANGQVSTAAAVVPLPAAAWSGLAVLGGLGAARLRRRSPVA